MNINKDEDMLVIIRYKGKSYWFAAFKEIWILDRIKWAADFIRNGIVDINSDVHHERYDIAIINESNAGLFIQLLIDDGYLIDQVDIANEFYKRFSSETTWWDIYDLFPDLFINFDSKNLYSQYVENMHYEKYIPDEWSGELVDFCNRELLPKSEMFWIRNGVDYRNEIILKEL